jgi:uncharacterized protein
MPVETPLPAGLADALLRHQRLVVAFSGGVDSSLLAWAAAKTLGRQRVLAATAVSASLAPEERQACQRLAASWGLRWTAVETDELSRPEYAANGTDRCYHCKSELMDRLGPLAEAEGATVVLGVNLDDLSDHRPGQKAASERGAAFPLVEAGMTKRDVRQAARLAGLEVWDKPAAPCLASRVPYGTPVTLGVLEQVGLAESALRKLGFEDLRVRHYGDLARVELAEADLDRALELRTQVVGALKQIGYRYVTLDLEGLRSGNLNPARVASRSGGH